MVRIGQRIRIISDNENYNKYRGKTWKIERIDRSEDDNRLYDPSVGGALVSCKGLPFSLYEYEFELV